MLQAISLWQPWATAMFLPAPAGHQGWMKAIETRHWPAPRRYVGQLVAIHAAKHRDSDCTDAIEYAEHLGYFPRGLRIPRGCIVGVARLERVVRVEDVRDTLAKHEAFFGNYDDGRFGWVFGERWALPRFDEPEVRGQQGFWTLSTTEEEQIRRLLGAEAAHA